MMMQHVSYVGSRHKTKGLYKKKREKQGQLQKQQNFKTLRAQNIERQNNNYSNMSSFMFSVNFFPQSQVRGKEKLSPLLVLHSLFLYVSLLVG